MSMCIPISLYFPHSFLTAEAFSSLFSPWISRPLSPFPLIHGSSLIKWNPHASEILRTLGHLTIISKLRFLPPFLSKPNPNLPFLYFKISSIVNELLHAWRLCWDECLGWRYQEHKVLQKVWWLVMKVKIEGLVEVEVISCCMY